MGPTRFRGRPQQIGLAAVIALVALRVTIGLHFSVEGINKFVDKKPFTAGFFIIAKGPFAPLLQSMVWDNDGLARLDLKQTQEIWDRYREQAVKYYGLDEKQAQQAQAIEDRREEQLQWHLAANAGDIDEYRKGLERLADYRRDAMRGAQVASLRGQTDSIERELWGKRSMLVGPVDTIWAGFEHDLNAFGKSAGNAGASVAIPKPGRRLLDTVTIDVIIRYFDVAVGVALIIGLFARPRGARRRRVSVVDLCFAVAWGPRGDTHLVPIDRSGCDGRVGRDGRRAVCRV